MTSAVVDTNILVRGAIAAHPQSASKRVVDAFFAQRFALLLSPDALLEIQRVLAEPDVRAKHGWTDDKIVRFCRALQAGALMRYPTVLVPPSITRDLTDTKWVALALATDADFLITHDHRHLHRLRVVGRTKIVTPAAFLRQII